MNKKILYTIFTAGIFALSSCVDLEQNLESSVNKGNFYQSEADFDVALNGVYQILTNRVLVGEMYGPWNAEILFINDLQTEYARRGTANSADITEIGNFAVTPNNAFVKSAWFIRYTGINRVNIFIDAVEANTTLNETTRKAYLGQAKFLRALLYFDLVRYYGGVPIVLHDGEGKGNPRNSIDEVYTQIVADLKVAENIPAGYSTLSSVVSSGAAFALLAKVYLTWAGSDTDYSLVNRETLYRNASNYAGKVIQSAQYSLLDRFIDNWSQDKKTNNSELIFTVEHKYKVNRFVGAYCTFSTGFANARLPVIAAIIDSIYNNFDRQDQRFRASVTKGLYTTTAWGDSVFHFERMRFRKYIDTLSMAN